MNVLDEQKRQQVLGLGRMGWSLRRIEKATGVRRETASAYLKAAGVAVRRRGGRRSEWPAKAATTLEVSTDPESSNSAISGEVSTDSGQSKPATTDEVSTDSAIAPWPPAPTRSARSSACEPFRELI